MHPATVLVFFLLLTSFDALPARDKDQGLGLCPGNVVSCCFSLNTNSVQESCPSSPDFRGPEGTLSPLNGPQDRSFTRRKSMSDDVDSVSLTDSPLTPGRRNKGSFASPPNKPDEPYYPLAVAMSKWQGPYSQQGTSSERSKMQERIPHQQRQYQGSRQATGHNGFSEITPVYSDEEPSFNTPR